MFETVTCQDLINEGEWHPLLCCGGCHNAGREHTAELPGGDTAVGCCTFATFSAIASGTAGWEEAEHFRFLLKGAREYSNSLLISMN